MRLNYIIFLIFISIVKCLYNPLKKILKSNLKSNLNLNLNNDYSKKISYNMSPYKTNIIKKINGFYGLIGPNIEINNNTKMYDLFSGDGMIQGVFFDKGELTLIKSMVKTEKYLFEQKHGIVPKNPLIIFFFFIMNKFNKLPNIGGLANTALLDINKQIYALYEMDQPYLLDINFNNKTINTIGKKVIEKIDHFSAHSKHINKNIESIEYKMDKNMVTFYDLDNKFNIKKSINFKFNYMPLTHDFYSTNKNVYLIDSPLEIDYNNVLFKKMPLHLNNKKETFIYIYNKIKEEITTYICNEGIFLFHFGFIQEDNDYIKIYAPLYDNFDFSSLDIQGKYRMILINKKNKKVNIIKNNELENYNLDFPISYDNTKIIMQNKVNNLVNGFIICKDLKIIKKIIFNNRNIKGEHSVIKINNIYYLIFFCEINNKNYISILNIDKYNNQDILDQHIIDIELPKDINFGFHSIFVKN
jgi:carotenoid cleavage dioxygenase-like enzyme